MDSRSKKIELLKGLLKGTHKIEEILPISVLILTGSNLTQGVYVDEDGKTYTEKEVEKLEQRKNLIIFKEGKTYDANNLEKSD